MVEWVLACDMEIVIWKCWHHPEVRTRIKAVAAMESRLNFLHNKLAHLCSRRYWGLPPVTQVM